MKNLSSILLSLTVLMVIMSSCSKCKDTPVPSFTVSFNLNGASGTLANQTVSSGTAITLSASSASTFYYTGYTFVGWNTLANGSGTSYTAGSSYTVSGNVTLYAIWQLSPTYTITFNLNGGAGSLGNAVVIAGASTSLPASSVGTFYYTDYTFVGWNTLANGTGTSYNAGSSYTPTSNVTLYAIWKSIFTAVFTATDESASALLRALPGSSANKAITLNVTTAGFVKLESLGLMTNGNIAIGYFWVISKDSANYTSSLNTIIPRTAMQASQTINLPLGKNVICIKTAAYASAISNGSLIGIKVTGSNASFCTNSLFTADASKNAAAVCKINCKFAGTTNVPSGQLIGATWGSLQIIPYSDQAATVYDGSLYPNIYQLDFATKEMLWFTGNTTGYSNIDFANTAGPLGRNFNFIQTDGVGGNSFVFINSQAGFSASTGLLSFFSSAPVQLIKSNLGNFAYSRVSANQYNSGSTVGPLNASWFLKSISFKENPEIWIYDPNGVRIY